MLSHGLFGCGTFRSNCKYFPSTFRKDSQMKMGDHDFVMDGDISVVKWKDRGKKCVLIGSTLHNSSQTTTVQRRNKKGDHETVPYPEAVRDYNRNMGGVDLSDQLHACYDISYKRL